MGRVRGTIKPKPLIFGLPKNIIFEKYFHFELHPVQSKFSTPRKTKSDPEQTVLNISALLKQKLFHGSFFVTSPRDSWNPLRSEKVWVLKLWHGLFFNKMIISWSLANTGSTRGHEASAPGHKNLSTFYFLGK